MKKIFGMVAIAVVAAVNVVASLNGNTTMSDLKLDNVEAMAAYNEIGPSFLYDKNGDPIYNTNPGMNVRYYTENKGYPTTRNTDYSQFVETVTMSGGGSVSTTLGPVDTTVGGELQHVYSRTRNIQVINYICTGNNSDGCHDTKTVIG